jgi:chorismate mutase
MRSLFLAVSLSTLACLSMTGCATQKSPAELDALLGVIGERLTIADPVALSKWDSGKPVEDLPREQQVIDGAGARAAEFDLEQSDVQQLFRAQIEANKLVQNALLAQWHAAGAAPALPRRSLTGDIRPQLDILQTRLLQTYSAFVPLRKDPNCQAWLDAARQRHTTDAIHDQGLVRATLGLCAGK